MTKRELNRDIKVLGKIHLLNIKEDGGKYDAYLGSEFRRLYYADKEFKYVNLQSLKILLKINSYFRFIPLHNFANHIDI